jgi:DNA-binding beta-propeller fold protein YncE
MIYGILQEIFMVNKFREIGNFAAACVLTFIVAGQVCAQTAPASVPNPYKPAIENWGILPEGRTWGSPAAVDIDRKGNIWVFERCGANSCATSSNNSIFEFDPAGKLLKSFGANMFVFPHSLFIDKDGNIWVADANGQDGKGQEVVKFSPDGKVLLTLGKPGIGGDGLDTFNRPSGVVVAPNGDIFVSDGHGADSNYRIMKFSKDGKFLMTWGKKGTAPGDFDELHDITMDAAGRLYVADRGNNRIQIFDQNGKFIDQWTQFGRPSAIYIDKKGTIYVATNTEKRVPEWKKGIWIGNIKDGSVTGFIPDPDAENLVVDDNGTIYSSDVASKMVRKWVKQ